MNVKRPKTREELRLEKDRRLILCLSVAVVSLTFITCLLFFALSFYGMESAAQVEAQKDIPSATVSAPVVVQTTLADFEPETKTVTETAVPCVVETTPEELELLALVIYQEAGGDNCSDVTRRMVGEVALNRVSDPRFPDTLEEVLLQNGQYGRLSWTGIRWPERASNPGEVKAVDRSYRIADEILTSTERLLPMDVIFQCEFAQTEDIVAVSDGFYFCR